MKKSYWANIISKQGKLPHLVIVTNGEKTDELPCTNTPVEKLKRTIRELYNITDDHIIFSVVLPDDSKEK